MSGISAAKVSADSSERYKALFEISDVIVRCRNVADLFHQLAECLHRVVFFDSVAVGLLDEDGVSLRLALFESRVPQKVEVGFKVPLDAVPGGYVVKHQQPIMWTADDVDSPFQLHHGDVLLRSDLKASYHLPLSTSLTRLGELVFVFKEITLLDAREREFMQLVANQVAVAIENATNFEEAQEAQSELQRKHEQSQVLLELTNSLVSNLELRELLRAVAMGVRRVVQSACVAVILPDLDNKDLVVQALDFPESKGFFTEGSLLPRQGSMAGRAFATATTIMVDHIDRQNYPPEVIRMITHEGFKSGGFVPIISRGRTLGVLAIGRREEKSFTPEQTDFLNHVAGQVALALENALAYGEIADLKDKLSQEKVYLEDEIRSELNFEEIIGESPALRQVLQLVETVATSDSTVLLLGETGTGKELIARAIHEHSRRKGRTFVKLNCAAIPTGLLESELFGHEKGAFTGAIAQRIGRLELADQGTLFLDEVGDVPTEIQPKLLRALQEREFERLGSAHTKKVNVRLVAATHRDLEKMIEAREFRSDLYYRLNVFPIRIPPLRERQEDIPLLVRYFVQKYARQMQKKIESVPAAAMTKLQGWQWPGNVRELENFIERAVILTSGPSLQVPVAELKSPSGQVVTASPAATLEATEREHIIKVLRDTRGVLAGPSGAASRLGLKRTTLQSKMKKLGIPRQPYQDLIDTKRPH